MKATYVSIWDGSTIIETSCDFDKGKNIVSNIETADVDEMDLDILFEEYVLLPDGTKIVNFYNSDDDTNYINGELE